MAFSNWFGQFTDVFADKVQQMGQFISQVLFFLDWTGVIHKHEAAIGESIDLGGVGVFVQVLHPLISGYSASCSSGYDDGVFVVEVVCFIEVVELLECIP